MRVIHWFRNDLRLYDNTALATACERANEWLPVFFVDHAERRIAAIARFEAAKSRRQ